VGVHRAFWYETKKGEAGFYDEDGGSLRKAFLKSPLKFVRVTSGFGRRVHPILGYSGMHRGIDFGAPAGTPVWAPADGWVRSAGPKGGAGNMIQLKHANGYETIYMHLQSISRGIRAGERVRQKQVIGYVGSTGLSTGPHLHYEMHRNGQAVSSLRQTFPPADPVPKAELDNYQKAISPQKEKLLAIPLPLAARTAAVRDSGQGAG
jgi:murein DD-endopeptidase MepM/ murein hydrolase activator NlpD